MEPSLDLLEVILHYILYEDSDERNIPFSEDHIKDVFHGCTYSDFLNACKYLEKNNCITYTDSFGSILIKEILDNCENMYINIRQRNRE